MLVKMNKKQHIRRIFFLPFPNFLRKKIYPNSDGVGRLCCVHYGARVDLNDPLTPFFAAWHRPYVVNFDANLAKYGFCMKTI